MDRNRLNSSTLIVELFMPALTLAFLGAYWWQAIDLSSKAKAFPSIVTVGALVLIALQTYNAFKKSLEPIESEIDETKLAEETPNPSWLTRSLKQRAGLLFLVGIVMYFWRDLGATAGIYIFLLSSLLILGERRPFMLIAFPSIFTLILVYLFQVVLTVIFPAGFFSVF